MLFPCRKASEKARAPVCEVAERQPNPGQIVGGHLAVVLDWIFIVFGLFVVQRSALDHGPDEVLVPQAGPGGVLIPLGIGVEDLVQKAVAGGGDLVVVQPLAGQAARMAVLQNLIPELAEEGVQILVWAGESDQGHITLVEQVHRDQVQAPTHLAGQ